MQEVRDITPNPKILRALGEIPFDPWQCIAELVDNSIDALSAYSTDEGTPAEKDIVVSWSNGNNVLLKDRTLEIKDNGPGMNLDTLQDSVRAGYSSNDPFSSLGLFGMGFNIATARLGERTVLLSTTVEAEEWVGIEIDFANLTAARTFSAPVVKRPKTRSNEHGTQIIVSKLKPGIAADLDNYNKQNQMRRVLSDIYTPILQEDSNLSIRVQSKQLTPTPLCLWDESRFIYLPKAQERVQAVIQIDRVLGEALFDVQRNRYLTPDEEVEFLNLRKEGGELPTYIVSRTKRVWGQLGIQRFADPNDFGIDFVRNGRKILRKDKSLFSFANQDGVPELEYPLELGTTLGGRIVGEIHIDHVPPTYQKNDFIRTDPTWYEVVEVLRGTGPIRQKTRKALNLSPYNNSPIDQLIRAYGRSETGTRHIFAPNEAAKQWAMKFRKGDEEFKDDTRWWEAAQDEDRRKAGQDTDTAPAANAGSASSDSIDTYLSDITISSSSNDDEFDSSVTDINPSASLTQSASIQSAPTLQPVVTLEALKQRSREIKVENREYRMPGRPSTITSTVWELTSGIIGDASPGEPSAAFNEGYHTHFFYNPRHPFLRDYPTTYKDLLLLYLAERFKVRDNISNSIASIYCSLMMFNLPELRVDQANVQEYATIFFSRLREKVPELLTMREQEAIDCVHESGGEVEDIVTHLVYNGDLLQKFQNRLPGSIPALSYAPARTLVRLVERFPEHFFDGHFFRMPYLAIKLRDANATERLRSETKDRLLSFIKDAAWVISETPAQNSRQKEELARCAHSLSFLQQETVDELS